ncbi:MAG: flagellar motor switch protein FliG [Verrucomicrobium sp.]|nr:flagellar motor switch protein FliG [Verrucomicrobium sp.]
MATATETPAAPKQLNSPGGGGKSAEEALRSWSKKQRLAGLLVVLGKELAAQILNEFDERDVEEVTTEMARIDFISMDMQRALLKEFTSVTVDAVASAAGGPQFAKDVLERSIGTFKANELINRIAPNKARTVDSSVLRDIQPRQLINLLRKEQIQTWALVLSYLDPARCAEVLSLLNTDFRTDVVERIATMEPTSAEVVEQILNHIKRRVAMKSTVSVTSSGGARILADVINALDDNVSKQLLTGLEERNPDLAKNIQKLLFVFEDIADMDKQTLARILREVDYHQLAIALKTASERLRSTVLGGLSKRAAEGLQEEIQFMPPVRLTEVEEAQQKIIDVVRQLEASGEITISKGGGRRELV